MKTLTIAVPAYNAAWCLEKCLDSFCRSEVLGELEIIVVNDGSKDQTSAIAHAYALRYPESVIVIDKENGGHGSGINAAIRIASGAYFQAVDSDDWVITENLPKLVDTLKKVNSDVVLCNYHMVDMKTGRKQPFVTSEISLNQEYSMEQFMDHSDKARVCCFYHGIIYRTSFYLGTGLRLSEKTFYEDQEYATIPFFYAKTVYPTGLFVYQYLVGNVEQSISNANQVRNMPQIEKILWNVCGFYQTHPDMSEARKKYFLFKLSTLLLSYYVAGLLKCRDRKHGKATAFNMRRAVKDRCPELQKSAEKRFRIAYLMFCLHVSAELLEKAKTTRLYYMIRRHI